MYRETAEKVKQPGFIAAVAAMSDEVNGRADARDDPEPDEPEADEPDVDETEPQADDEGTSPAPKPKGDDEPDEDEQVEDDYDEEDVATPAEEPEADRPEDSPTDKDDPSDPEKVWSQYKTDEDRKKALAENKRYAIEMANKAKAADEEIARLKAEKASPPPEPEKVEDVVKRLFTEDADVKRVVLDLRAISDEVKEKDATVKSTEEKLESTRKTIGRLENNIEFLQEELKSIPADNYEAQQDAQQKIDRLKAQKTQLSTEVHAIRIQLRDEQAELADLQKDYREGSNWLMDRADSDIKTRAEKVKADADFQSTQAAAEKDWTDTFKTVMDEMKLTEGMKPTEAKAILATYNDRLLEKANLWYDHNPGGKLNFKTFMATIAKEFKRERDLYRGASTRTYVEKKIAQTAQPGPPAERSVARSATKGKRLSSRQAASEAGAQLTRLMRR